MSSERDPVMGDTKSTQDGTDMQDRTRPLKKRRGDRRKKQDPKSCENILKSMENMSDVEKVAYLTEKYSELYKEKSQLDINMQAYEKHMVTCVREREREQSELARVVLQKGHLEDLCRKLQGQNKTIKEENIARLKEEVDRRREVTNNFTERLNALTNLMTESKDKSNKVKEENQNMTDKLSQLYEQFQQRETHLESVTRQLDLQKKLSETTLKKNQIEHEAEKQTWLKEKRLLEAALDKSEHNVTVLQENVKSLQAYIDVYKSQYSDFETTMMKSNKVFDSFKAEMAKLQKQVTVLQVESNKWRARWQSCASSLITLSEQYDNMSHQLDASEKKVVMLKKLCHKLQDERTSYLNQLRDHGIEPNSSYVSTSLTIADFEMDRDASTSAVDEPGTSNDFKNDVISKLRQEIRKVQQEDAFLSAQQSSDDSKDSQKPANKGSKRKLTGSDSTLTADGSSLKDSSSPSSSTDTFDINQPSTSYGCVYYPSDDDLQNSPKNSQQSSSSTDDDKDDLTAVRQQLLHSIAEHPKDTPGSPAIDTSTEAGKGENSSDNSCGSNTL